MTDQVTKGIIVKGELMEENKRIAWKSTGGDLTTSGQVTFKALP